VTSATTAPSRHEIASELAMNRQTGTGHGQAHGSQARGTAGVQQIAASL